MAEEYKPYATFSVDAEIEAGKDLYISEDTMSYKEKIPMQESEDSIIIRFHNIITQHIDALKDYITDLEFDDDEYYNYLYQPKLFCYEAYGTPELATSILYINNMTSATEFNKKKLKVFTTDIIDAINELFSILEEDLEDNRATVNQ